jgi:RNA polymerase sigma-70 factor (ECF subfamily)
MQSDAELLRLSMAGDEDAFLLLYNRLKAPLFRYAFHITGSQACAEEVVQEVFISLLNSGHRYKPAQGGLAAFVFGIARNFIRRIKRREGRTEEFPGVEALERKSLNRPEADDLSSQIIRDQGVERIRTAIATLPDHYRQAIVLCDLCELSYTEAASRLQCKVGTVRSRLNRAHALLALKLKQTKKPQPELQAPGTEECLI